jgi:hypothetical protein
MAERLDAVILGAGPAGEVALNTLLRAGKRVALVERELIGGECTSWGCIPPKTLLRPPELRGESTRSAGVSTPELLQPRLSAYRDSMVSNRDDSKRAARYEERGVTVVKGSGRIAGPGRVETEGGTLQAGAVVVATGAEAVVPPFPGLREAGFWTNREVTALTEIPESVVFVGGGVVSVELGQFLARFGARVTIVQGPPRLADREDPRVGELLGEILAADGGRLPLGRRATGVRREDGERRRRRGRPLPGGGGRVGGRRRHRGGHVHARGQVPGPHRGRGHPRPARESRLPRRSARRLHGSGARRGGHAGGGRPRGRAQRGPRHRRPAHLDRAPLHVRGGAARHALRGRRRRPRRAGRRLGGGAAGGGMDPSCGARHPRRDPIPVLEDTIAQFPSFSEAFGFALRSLPEEETLMPMDHCAHAMLEAWRVRS